MSYQNIIPITKPFNTPVGQAEFEFTGDWGKLQTFLKYMGGGSRSRGIKRDIAKAQRDFLFKYRLAIAGGLASGGVSIGGAFAGHKAGYREGRDPVGVRSGNYLRALRNLKITQKGYIVSLNFSRGDLHTKSRPNKGGYILSKYAGIFEGGSSRQVARPLWKQTFTHIGGGPALIKKIRGSVQKRLGRMGIRISK